MNLKIDFEKSYSNFLTYPINTGDRRFYLPLLNAYEKRLKDAEVDTFIKDDTNADLPFRDLDSAGQWTSRKNVFSDAKLRLQLGDTFEIDSATQTQSGHHATKADPHCRFVFISAAHSRAKLKLTRPMLARLMSYHQITPRYLDFLFLFGERSGPHDLRYSAFREQTDLKQLPGAQYMPDMRRSGQTYQICYNLKTVNALLPAATPLGDQRWSIRQAAIYHRFDVIYGTSLWLVTKGDLGLKDRVDEILGPAGRAEDKSFATPTEAFRSSLAMHSCFAHWATENWQMFAKCLMIEVDLLTDGAVLGSRTPGISRKEYSPTDLQNVQILEERCQHAAVILGGNESVLDAMRKYYAALVSNTNFSLRQWNGDDIEIFIAQLDDTISEIQTQLLGIKLLTDITSERKTLILQHLQSQAAEEMRTLSIMSQKEAVAMRIITAVTLLYLPATFVSTFFSTDVVKYQNDSDPDGNTTSFSPVALYRWLQVTLPLTFLTLVAAWLAYKRAKNLNPFSRLIDATRYRQSLLPTNTGKS